MDEIGLLVKHVSKEGFIYFIKIGGIDDRVSCRAEVIIKSKAGAFTDNRPEASPPSERRGKKEAREIRDMFIDNRLKTKEETLGRISIGDQVIFEPNAGCANGQICYARR